MRRASWIAYVAACGGSIATWSPSTALADGDQDHEQSNIVHAPGGGIVFEGAGFAARPDQPVIASRTLTVGEIPAGFEVERAYLYWVTIGGPDGDVLLNDQAVVGDLIGTSPNTCWPGLPYTNGNFVHRADVTDLVTGNGDYEVEGLPSSTNEVDSQGAELVVIYRDPAATDENFRVVINDGAFTQGLANENGLQGSAGFTLELTPHLVPTDFTEAFFTILGGDGEDDALPSISIINNASEGRPQFQGQNLADPAQRDFFDGDLGRFWDDETFDVTNRLSGGVSAISWGQLTCRAALVGLLNECGFAQVSDPGDGDCVVYPATFLTLRFPDADLDGVEDSRDNCVDDPNGGQENFDGDPLGDVCDPDDDDDGLDDVDEDDQGSNPFDSDSDDDGDLDGDDNCLLNVNPDQMDADGDGIGDVCEDSDGDGVVDADDNCPRIDNPRQTDTDGDGDGDACDDDDDDDGLDDDEEDDIGTNPLNPDTDEDGELDGVDPCPLDPRNDCPAGQGGAGGSGDGGAGGGDGGAGGNGDGGAGGNGDGGAGASSGDGGSTASNTGSTGTGTATNTGTGTGTGTATETGTATDTGAGGGLGAGIIASGGACAASTGPAHTGAGWLMAAAAALAATFRRRRRD